MAMEQRELQFMEDFSADGTQRRRQGRSEPVRGQIVIELSD
jgi:hypothetical protein